MRSTPMASTSSDYYLSFFHDRRALDFLDLTNYGGLFDMTAAAVNSVSPFGTYETRHLLNGLVGILGVIGARRLGRALGGARCGFIAALFLLLIPDYYGQMFNNPKDIPFAVGMVWSLDGIVRMIPALPRPNFAAVAKLGLAIGLTMAVRVGGLMLFGYVGLILLLSALWRGVAARDGRRVIAEGSVGLARVLVPAALVAYPLMLLFWPWAQMAPIAHPLAALAAFSHQDFPCPTLFDGSSILAADLPWEYLPVSIAIKLPELVLALLVAAPAVACVAFARAARPLDRARTLALFLLGFAILFPVAYAIAIRAVLFDGMRQFIFVLPPIACAAALAADRALDRLARRPWRRHAYGALALYGCYHVGVMALLHPDEYVYYNLLVGGVPGARGRFKLDYWANSYAEAVRGLEALSQGRVRRRFPAPRLHRRRVRAAGLGNVLLPEEFHLRRPRDGAVLHRLHQGRLRPRCPRQSHLPRRASGHAAVAGDRPACRAGATDAAGRRKIGAEVERSEYDRLTAVEDRMWWFRGLHANLIAAWERSRPPASVRILDAGCGTGGFLARFAAQAPGVTAFGAEIDVAACRRARAKSGGAVVAGSVDALPFADQSLDAIFSADVLCHRRVDECAALGEFHRCLRPGGIVVLNLPAYRWLYCGA